MIAQQILPALGVCGGREGEAALGGGDGEGDGEGDGVGDGEGRRQVSNRDALDAGFVLRLELHMEVSLIGDVSRSA